LLNEPDQSEAPFAFPDLIIGRFQQPHLERLLNNDSLFAVANRSTYHQQRDKVKDTMRHSPISFIILVISIVGLAGCEVAGDIFKAGVWVGAILVIGIIALVIWMFSKGGS